jgi:hypothetical protein
VSNYRLDEDGEFKETFYPGEDCWVKHEDHQELVQHCDSLQDRLTAAENREKSLDRNYKKLHELYVRLESERDQLRAQVEAAKQQAVVAYISPASVKLLQESEGVGVYAYNYDPSTINYVDEHVAFYAGPIITEQPSDSVQARIAFYSDNPKQAHLLSWNELGVGEHDLYTRPSKSVEISGESDELIGYYNKKYRSFFESSELACNDRNQELLLSGEIIKAYARPPLNKPDVPEGYALIPIDANGLPKVTSIMKADNIGEFEISIDFPEWDEDDECFTCEMEAQKRDVPWDKCKEIYKAMAWSAMHSKPLPPLKDE